MRELRDQEVVEKACGFAEFVRSWPQLSSLAENELVRRGWSSPGSWCTNHRLRRSSHQPS
jgi:hypothetical protein